MADRSSIEWTDATWNPVTGCTEVSPGCDHCYAKTFANRWRGTPGHHFENGFDLTLRPERLDQPLRWKRPRRVFVNSMSDLFHDQVPDEYIARVLAVMAWSHRHTFQVLTKRHGRMRSLLSSSAFRDLCEREWCNVQDWTDARLLDPEYVDTSPLVDGNWPPPNVWLGVSVESQQWANLRIPALMSTPAAVRFLSCEPLLGPIDLHHWTRPHAEDCQDENGVPPWCTCGRDNDGYLDWVIVGGESGPAARPMHHDWARQLRDDCAGAGVPFFFKQWGEWIPEAQGAHALTRETARTALFLEPDGATRPAQRGARGNAVTVQRVGKKASGRELDGRTWDEFPATTTGALA